MKNSKRFIHPVVILFSILALTLNSCDNSVPDPCASISCIYGECTNGDCECDDGYEGADCSTQIIPLKIKIDVTVSNVPLLKPDGSDWDSFDYPDIYLEVVDKDSQSIYTSTTADARNPSGSHAFTGIEITKDMTDTYTIILYDEDVFPDTDDNMGLGLFIPYFDTNGFPDTFTATSNNGASFVLEYTYEW